MTRYLLSTFNFPSESRVINSDPGDRRRCYYCGLTTSFTSVELNLVCGTQPSEPILDIPPELEDQYRLIQYTFPTEVLKVTLIRVREL